MKYLILALLLVSSSLAASSEQFSPTVGAGNISCGQFLESQNDDRKVTDISWAQGFLSGMNAADYRSGKKFVNLPDVETINFYLVSYCTKNILGQPVFGAFSLYQELRKAQKLIE